MARARGRARRDGCRRETQHRDRAAPGQRLVSRLAGLHGPARGLRRRAGRVRRARGRLRRRPRADASCTDESWRAVTGEVLADDLYNGETIDARLRDDAWRHPGFDDAGWDAVHDVEFDPSRLVAAHVAAGPPAGRARRRARLDLARRARRSSTSGRTSSGFVRVRGQRTGGHRGRAPPRRGARARRARHPAAAPRRGDGPLHPERRHDDVFEPTLTFHGFRYAEVTGWPGELDPAALTAVVVGTDIAPIGSFACSDPLLEPAAQQRRVGHEGQLPERAHRLPAARRAARLDRRPRRLRADGGVPRRRRVVPRRLAGGCRARASGAPPSTRFRSWCRTS